MIASLGMLARLRFRGAVRRWQRSLSRPKGIVVTVLVALMFLPSVAAFGVFVIHPPPSPFTPQIVRFGPWALLAFTLFTLATSSGPTGLYFAPAEVDFLFPGPYTRRQLLTYKLVVTGLGIGLTSLFIGTMGAVTAPSVWAALVATFLTLLFLHLIHTAIGLLVSFLGSLVWRQSQRWVAVAVAVLALLVVLPSSDRLVGQDWQALGRAVEASPVAQAVVAPFTWFVRAYAAPDLATFAWYGSLSLAINAALLAAIFLLDAGFLEVAAKSSAQRLAKIQRMTRGGGAIQLGRSRNSRLALRVPGLPWLGGTGPNLWRQLIGAVGNPTPVLSMMVVVGSVAYVYAMLFSRGSHANNPAFLGGFLGATGMPLVIVLSLFLAYDFRGDLDVIETLKMLPIAPRRLALGQVLTPTLLASLIQASGCLGVVLALGGTRGHGSALAAILIFLAPANLLFYVIENILFLWYPTRTVAGQFNGVAAVRQVLVMLSKMLALGVAAALTAGAGVATYFVFQSALVPALAVAWTVLAALSLALIPLLARAFDRFDVGADTPA